MITSSLQGFFRKLNCYLKTNLQNNPHEPKAQKAYKIYHPSLIPPPLWKRVWVRGIEQSYYIMSNGFDIGSFIPKFVDENRDRIQKLNRAILAFEKDASNLELLKEIMREVHTLKGTARMMGFVDIVTLSHKVEDM